MYTLRPDDFGKENRPTFFGVELPKKGDIETDANGRVTISPSPELDHDLDEEDDVDELEMENAEKFFLTEHPSTAVNKRASNNARLNNINEQGLDEFGRNEEGEFVGDPDDQTGYGFEENARKSDMDFKNINNLEDFKRQAGRLLGDEKEYDDPIDLPQAYKILKGLVTKQAVSKFDVRNETLSKPKFNKKNVPRIGKLFNQGICYLAFRD